SGVGGATLGAIVGAISGGFITFKINKKLSEQSLRQELQLKTIERTDEIIQKIVNSMLEIRNLIHDIETGILLHISLETIEEMNYSLERARANYFSNMLSLFHEISVKKPIFKGLDDMSLSEKNINVLHTNINRDLRNYIENIRLACKKSRDQINENNVRGNGHMIAYIKCQNNI
ncbi:hypothetical protein, partial [Stenotrophomonas maltophilia group sp. RNC7]|uniref:hypothetical protein n=1 Tax=Stenotrophomonas maltophilia group sp. RNC7 TaxID=3071467 RepID=UPI0027DFD96D